MFMIKEEIVSFWEAKFSDYIKFSDDMLAEKRAELPKKIQRRIKRKCCQKKKGQQRFDFMLPSSETVEDQTVLLFQKMETMAKDDIEKERKQLREFFVIMSEQGLSSFESGGFCKKYFGKVGGFCYWLDIIRKGGC